MLTLLNCLIFYVFYASVKSENYLNVLIIYAIALLTNRLPYCLIARVALVKCRDLHWAMMANKDQKDSNLSSIRMLIVADGANPCE